MSNDKPVLKVVASMILPVDGNKYILLKTSKDNKWGFPGGSVDPFEDFAVAATREVREEIGVEAVADKLIGAYCTKTSRGNGVLNFVYLGTIMEGRPEILEPEKITDVKYASLKQIRDFYWEGDLRSPATIRSLEDHLVGRHIDFNTIRFVQ